MTYLAALITLAFAHLIMLASPGPNLILISNHAATLSKGSALLVSVGTLLAELTWASTMALGLGGVIVKFPMIFNVIQYFGAIYLAWLGTQMIIHGVKNNYHKAKTCVVVDGKASSFALKGYMVNITNPKTTAYYISIFSLVIAPTSPSWVFLAAVAVVFLVTATWWIFIVFLFSTKAIQNYFDSMRQNIDLLMGIPLVLLGISLVPDY